RVVRASIAPSPHPGADLAEVVEGALVREGHLFTTGEVVALRALLAVGAPARELWARLSLRTGGGGEGPPVFRVAALRYDLDVVGAVAELAEAGLAHVRLPDDRCLPAFDVPALKHACARLGMPIGGTRTALVERLRGKRWVDEPVVMLAHTELVRRCELLWFQSPYVDRTTLVIERLGQLRWPTYAPTGGPGLFPDRAALRTYERARAGAWRDPGEPLRLALAGRPEVGLSPWRRALEAVLAEDPDADVLGRLAGAGAPVRHAWALRLEKEGRRREALAVCAGEADDATAVALERTGKRLARALGVGWAPRPPLRLAPTRRLRLVPGPREGARPTWVVGDTALPVEAAVLRLLAEAGRVALHAENWLWTSLYALVFRDLYFLPVPGMLPTARRDGPLDVGTPGFHARRREAVEARLAALAEEGPSRFAAGWTGERLAGLYAGDVVSRWCASIPGKTAAAVLGRLAREGWAAARGLPDLYIFPGAATRVEGGIPARVEDRDLLAEIKGPTDTLRDEQRLWHAWLLDRGIPVELWEVAGQIRESA
ncbi:MAG: VRR-NUC domain-containing protein, partial [Myxococcota bacterium]